MTAAKQQADPLLSQLEKAITDTLKKKGVSAKDKSAAVQNGIKLLQIKHKLTDDDEGSFFGDAK